VLLAALAAALCVPAAGVSSGNGLPTTIGTRASKSIAPPVCGATKTELTISGRIRISPGAKVRVCSEAEHAGKQRYRTTTEFENSDALKTATSDRKKELPRPCNDATAGSETRL